MQGKANNLVSIVPLSTKKPMKKTEEKKTKQKNCMQEIKAWCGEKFRWILSIVVVFLWIGIWCYKEPIFCFLSDDLYKERNTIIIWIAIIFIFFCVGIFTWKKNTLFSRASILIIIAFTGLFLVLFREDIFNFFFFDFKNGAQDNLTKDSNNFITLLLSSLIFLTLWFFRTYDVREQIGQQDFHDALRMLADDKLVSQEIAVLRLIDISKKNKVYNDIIKLAFIKRMKAPYKEAKEAAKKSQMKTAKLIIKAFQQVERRTYAQYIFRWLRKEYNKGELDLVNLDLSCQDFRDEDNKRNKIKHFRTKKGKYFVLDSINLVGADLTGVDLTKFKLVRANFYGANLTESNLTRANLTGANLRCANLTESNLTRANLTRANLRETILTKAILTEADLTEVNLTGVDLTEVDLTEANLTRAKLEGANLTGKDLTEVDLRGANLTRAKLEGANLTGKDLTGADLSGAKLRGADLTGANLRGADLTGADLTGAKLRGADLTGANLRRADLTGANRTYLTK